MKIVNRDIVTSLNIIAGTEGLDQAQALSVIADQVANSRQAKQKTTKQTTAKVDKQGE